MIWKKDHASKTREYKTKSTQRMVDMIYYFKLHQLMTVQSISCVFVIINSILTYEKQTGDNFIDELTMALGKEHPYRVRG